MTDDVLKLKWLMIQERLELSVAKIAFRSLNDNKFPENIKYKLYELSRSLRNTNERAHTIKDNGVVGSFNMLYELYLTIYAINCQKYSQNSYQHQV